MGLEHESRNIYWDQLRALSNLADRQKNRSLTQETINLIFEYENLLERERGREENVLYEKIFGDPRQSNTRDALLEKMIGDSKFRFSVRAIKAMQSIGIRTLGDLIKKRVSDFAGIKNFGPSHIKKVQDEIQDLGYPPLPQ